MKIKVSELSGAALDWAVARLTNTSVNVLDVDNSDEKWQIQRASYPYGAFWPSQDWEQGGPLLEKYSVCFDYRVTDDGLVIAAACRKRYDHAFAGVDSYLIAGMRAIVAAMIGEEVEVPEGLLP